MKVTAYWPPKCIMEVAKMATLKSHDDDYNQATNQCCKATCQKFLFDFIKSCDNQCFNTTCQKSMLYYTKALRNSTYVTRSVIILILAC